MKDSKRERFMFVRLDCLACKEIGVFAVARTRKRVRCTCGKEQPIKLDMIAVSLKRH